MLLCGKRKGPDSSCFLFKQETVEANHVALAVP